MESLVELQICIFIGYFNNDSTEKKMGCALGRQLCKIKMLENPKG